MARTAATPTEIKLPKNLPEGVEIATASRKLGRGKDSFDGTARVVAPIEGNAEGLRNWIELRSKLGKGLYEDGEAGIVDSINAIRTAAFASVVPYLTPETEGKSAALWLPFSAPRVVNKEEITASWFVSFQREHKRPPNEKEYAEHLKSLADL